MAEVYVVTTRGEDSGEVRAYVMAHNHREALLKFLDKHPGIDDFNTVYIAAAEAGMIIL